jgi:hypothetical protein
MIGVVARAPWWVGLLALVGAVFAARAALDDLFRDELRPYSASMIALAVGGLAVATINLCAHFWRYLPAVN